MGVNIVNQHGDLLFQKVDEMPKDGKVLKVSPGFVLERGEGVHTHVLEDVKGVTVVEKDGDIYVRVTEPVRINHEEHGFQTLKPGVYKKQIEREFDYETNEARNTRD